MFRVALLVALPVVVACGARPGTTASPTDPSPPAEPAPTDEPQASVTRVEVSGSPGDYTFAVTIRSDETGCEQYADWWEVVDDEGGLVYRRILGHSHPDEQPFTRSGGPVDVQPDDALLVRAHLNQGYAGVALRGSVAAGFDEEVAADLEATDLETAPPRPGGCLF